MEVLLLQSCKKIDVKFLFKKDPYDELIINSGIDLIIDATGGKIYQYYPEHEKKKFYLIYRPMKITLRICHFS